MTGHADVVVVGGGHNGLVAAAYLARAGLRTVVCERREVLGGAAVSEHPFGPDFTVTSLSYVVSLLPPDLVRDLRLEQHGYHVYPQGPYFAPRADGGCLRLPDDPAQRHAEIARFSARDADAYPGYVSHLDGLGRVLGPLLHQIPPRLGSRRPQDLLRQARLLTQLRSVDERGAVDLTRLLTGSIADLLEAYFESDAMLGLLSVSGVIGTWAGPRSAGTAYVMLHHHIGQTDGQSGAWGFPRGGMGAVTGALARSARTFGAQLRTGAEVARIRTRDGRVTGVTLASGQSIDAPVVVTTAHPQISFLRLLDPSELPGGFVADIRGWHSRSGTVKINLALDRLPVFSAHPDPDPSVYGGTIVLAESLGDIETAFQQAVSGRPADLPFADICIPSVFDDSLAPAGKHVMSMFTQWVPCGYASGPHAADLEAYADRVLARVEAVAPGFTGSVLHRQVIGPHQMQEEYALIGGNIFHGELSLGQMFHARPAAGYADLRTPVRGLYQAGSATHGGGGVTGIPGRNVVGQILADRRAERWRRRAAAVRKARAPKPVSRSLRAGQPGSRAAGQRARLRSRGMSGDQHERVEQAPPVRLGQVPACRAGQRGKRGRRRGPRPHRGARVLRRQPVARALFPVTVVFLGANASLSAVLIPLGLQRRGGNEHTGFLLSGLGAGLLLGAPLIRRLMDRVQPRSLLTASLAATAAGYFGLFTSSSLTSALPAVVATGVFGSMSEMIPQTAVQRVIPNAALGRVSAVFLTGEAAATLLGSVAGPFLARAAHFTGPAAVASLATLGAAALARLAVPRMPAIVPVPPAPLADGSAASR